MSDKQAKGIGKHEKFSCQKPQFHQSRKERERPKTRNVTGVANTILIKDDLLQPWKKRANAVTRQAISLRCAEVD